jgi:diguanylate cyclase (GGDEF)-like protein/PAS domain S-box-containing protein
MHFSFIAYTTLTLACIIWLAVSGYYIYFTRRHVPNITRKVSVAFALHSLLILGLCVCSLLIVPTINEQLFLPVELPLMFSGLLALVMGFIALAWFLPKKLPSYSRREKRLETSLSDTNYHLKSLYSLSQQGVMLICTDNFKIDQANNEARRVLKLINPDQNEASLPQGMKQHIQSWLKHGRANSLLNLPTQHGTLSLNLDITAFAMEKSPVVLVQIKDIESLPESQRPHAIEQNTFEVQLIERFDEFVNIHADTASELVEELGHRLSNFKLFEYVQILERDETTDWVKCSIINEFGLQKTVTVKANTIEPRLLMKDSGIQIYTRSGELKLPECPGIENHDIFSIAALTLDDQLGKEFTVVLYTQKINKLTSAMLALVEQLRNQISYRIHQLSQSSLHQKNALLQKQLTSIIESSANSIILTNTDFIIEYINPKLCETSGYTEDQLLGRPFNILCPIDDNPLIHRSIRDHVESNKPWYGEVVQRDNIGHMRWSNLQLSFMHDDNGDVSHYIMHLEDRTELYQAQDEINQLTHFDPLTNLPNRNLLNLRLKSELEENHQQQILALMYLDLDGFKHINDSLGHQSGDRLLKQIAERLSDILDTEDTLARLGGDEFAILIPSVLAKGSIVNLVNKILDTISVPTIIDDNSVVLTGSIGITMYPQDAMTVEELQKNADLAMYQAKKEQGNSYHIYTPELNARAVKRLDLEHRLRLAIQNEELELHFQPQVDINTGKLLGAEALVRWTDEEKGAISPVQFIPLAEETGLISELSDWVVRQACAYTRMFLAHTSEPIKIAINLSAYQFKRPDQLFQTLEQALHEQTLPPECIELELTESMLMDNVEATKRTLTQLHNNGFNLAIDDFGTGYSSLAYLKEFPIDKLKIDRSFIKDINRSKDDAAITTAVIAMAHKLGLSVLAEGVENTSQLQFLNEHHCDSIQGYYYSRPIPADQFIDLLTGDRDTPDLLQINQ